MTAALVQPAWSAPVNVIAGTTLRRQGVSDGVYSSLNLAAHVGDEPHCVAANRQRLVDDCGLPAEPAWLMQTHSTIVATENVPSDDCDAFITQQKRRVCVVLTADCLPVILVASDGSEVATAHAGWRGLCAGILETTLEQMQASPQRLLAWLGPAISQPAFEVGDEVRQAFLAVDATAAEHFVENTRGRYQADLYGLARQRLKAAGVAEITGGDHCTFTDPQRFFSYRRDGQCGRMATFAYIA